MKTVARSLVSALVMLGLTIGSGGSQAGCGGDEDELPNPPEASAGSGGAGGAGGQGGAGASSLDPAHCSFETPPTHEPKPAPTPGAIRAGLGEAVLDLPIGTPLGGYGARVRGLGGQTLPIDKRRDRINTGMVPSLGLHDAPWVTAVALEVAGEKLVFVRVPSIYAIDNAVFDLEKELAADGSMRGRVVLATTHSHAAYAAWQASYILMPGGNDRSREDMHKRVVASMKAAAEQALSGLAPAKLGVAVTSNFDPDDTVSVDRRGENDNVLGPDGNTGGKRKDGQAWALRVDKADGSPLVALVDFPIHGTVTEDSNQLATTDAPGAIERSTSDLLGYPVIHLQGAGGDVTPVYDNGRAHCADELRCLDMPSLELIGSRAARLLEPFVGGIKTGDTAALEVVTRSFRTGRNVVITRPDGRKLEYAPVLGEDENGDDIEPDYKLLDDDGKVAVPIDEFNTIDGAGLCGDPKGTTFAPLQGQLNKLGPYRSCVEVGSGKALIFALFNLLPKDYQTPGCDTVRVTASAIRIAGTPSGDYLITTVPGEPTAPLVTYLRNRSPAGPDRTLILGYSQDHIGYVLTSEDWLAGGYEPSINLWGPLEGEQVVEGVLDAAKIAWTPEVEDPEVGSSRYLGFQYAPPVRELKVTTTTDHGTAVDAPKDVFWPDAMVASPTATSAEVPRAVGAARFVFAGGDPLVDHPMVVIERETDPGKFEPLLSPKGRPASTRYADVILTYSPSPIDAEEPTAHHYAVTWQPVPPGPFDIQAPKGPYSLPAGKYRFHATGKAQAASGLVDYDVTSPAFSVVPASLTADSKLTLAGNDATIKAMLGDAPGLRVLVIEGASDQAIPLAGPWTLTAKAKKDGKTTSLKIDAPAKGEGKITLDAALAADLDSIEVRDEFGNGGVLKP